jgi:hypothetical protein
MLRLTAVCNAVAILNTRACVLKAIFEDKVRQDSTRVCYQQEGDDERQGNAGQRQSCTEVEQ